MKHGAKRLSRIGKYTDLSIKSYKEQVRIDIITSTFYTTLDSNGDKPNGSRVSENYHNYTKNGSIRSCWSSKITQFNKGKPTSSH